MLKRFPSQKYSLSGKEKNSSTGYTEVNNKFFVLDILSDVPFCRIKCLLPILCSILSLSIVSGVLIQNKVVKDVLFRLYAKSMASELSIERILFDENLKSDVTSSDCTILGFKSKWGIMRYLDYQ